MPSSIVQKQYYCLGFLGFSSSPMMTTIQYPNRSIEKKKKNILISKILTDATSFLFKTDVVTWWLNTSILVLLYCWDWIIIVFVFEKSWNISYTLLKILILYENFLTNLLKFFARKYFFLLFFLIILIGR